MKKLIIMRHGKASLKKGDTDFERPLKKRGKKQVKYMSNLIAEQKSIPQLILASPALRARSSAELFIKESDLETEVEYIEKLYRAEPSDVIATLQRIPDDIETLMIIGHNPGLEGTLQILSGEIEALPSGSLAILDIHTSSWQEIDLDSHGKLIALYKPPKKD